MIIELRTKPDKGDRLKSRHTNDILKGQSISEIYFLNIAREMQTKRKYEHRKEIFVNQKASII